MRKTRRISFWLEGKECAQWEQFLCSWIFHKSNERDEAPPCPPLEVFEGHCDKIGRKLRRAGSPGSNILDFVIDNIVRHYRSPKKERWELGMDFPCGHLQCISAMPCGQID